MSNIKISSPNNALQPTDSPRAARLAAAERGRWAPKMSPRTVALLAGIVFVSCSTPNQRPAPSGMTFQQFQEFSQLYFEHPQPDLIERAMLFVDESGVAKDPNLASLIAMSFSCITHRAELKGRRWAVIDSLQRPSRGVLQTAVSTVPDALMSAEPLSAQRNDQNWACYFGSGDTKYLKNIVDTLSHLAERKDLNLYLAAASAQWSLASNARYPEVRAYLESLRSSQQYGEVVKGILGSNPEAIRAETKKTLSEQHANGVW